MNLRQSALLGLVLLLPVSVEVPTSSDSGDAGGETRITAMGGIGRYAIIDRGCEGQVLDTHPIDFREAGGEIEHRFPGGATLGLRGGAVREEEKSQAVVTDYSVYPYRDSLVTTVGRRNNRYFNPSLSHETHNLGVGAGWMWSAGRFRVRPNGGDSGPTFHFRIGSRERVHFLLEHMESLPLYSGGGHTEFGLGIHPHRLWDFHGGIGGGPYDGGGFVLRADCRVRPNWAVVGRARLGGSGGEPQSGVGFGLSYVSRSPVEPEHGTGRRERIESGWGLGPRRHPPADAPTEPAGSEPKASPGNERLPEYGAYQYVDSLPVLVSRIEPAYSDSLRQAGTGGTVRLALLIGRDGQVLAARVMKSIPALDEAALACVRQWRFRPAVRSGRALAYWLVAPVTFGSE